MAQAVKAILKKSSHQKATTIIKSTTKIVQVRAKNICASIKKDERFRKTEEAIFGALKELIKEHPMTVSLHPTELARRSRIAASTFYRHYQSIDDALKNNEQNLRRRFRFMVKTKMKDNLSLRQSITKIIYFIYQNREIFAIIFYRNNRRLIENIFTAIKPKIYSACHLPKNSNLIFRIALSEIYVLMEEWHDKSFDPNEISKLADNILYIFKNARNHLIIVAK